MKLWSDSWANGERIPSRLRGRQARRQGRRDLFREPQSAPRVERGAGRHAVVRADLPRLRRPEPRRRREPGPAARSRPSLPRIDFFHWVLVDVPPAMRGVTEGEFSRGFTARGKPGPAAPHGARQGINDYTGWFAGDPRHGRRLLRLRRPVPAVERCADPPLRVHAVRAHDVGAPSRAVQRRRSAPRSAVTCSPRPLTPAPTR